jgi:ketosteroid isomerase-like protein
MSNENVELLQAGFKAWNAGDMDALRELLHPDIIMRTPEGWPEPGPLVGPEAVMRQFDQLRETWDADVVEPVSDFIDAADRVAVRMVWRGVGQGPESNMEWTYVATIRKGRIFGVEYFWNHAEALEALGLSE